MITECTRRLGTILARKRRLGLENQRLGLAGAKEPWRTQLGPMISGSPVTLAVVLTIVCTVCIASLPRVYSKLSTQGYIIAARDLCTRSFLLILWTEVRQ